MYHGASLPTSSISLATSLAFLAFDDFFSAGDESESSSKPKTSILVSPGITRPRSSDAASLIPSSESSLSTLFCSSSLYCSRISTCLAKMSLERFATYRSRTGKYRLTSASATTIPINSGRREPCVKS